MFYLAKDVYDALAEQGCEYEGDTFSAGAGWFTASGQVFLTPEPTTINRKQYLLVEAIDRIVADRWLGFTLSHLPRHEP